MPTPPSHVETCFKIRELRETDNEALLAFETGNRFWFESHIEARPSSFYSLQGVADHIQSYLQDFAAGTWHPFIIEDAHGKIVGRANLKSINTTLNTAEVGYRVAEDMAGQGLATMALRHLIEQARERWGLGQLVAYVYEDNAGSAKVLARCGFLLALPDTSTPENERRFTYSI
ncbi:GNAT family N-acetyltransferase [Pseudomonas sp. LP_7_YM]|uniref:GNAT family N-acetyltransferase n=1 Tax=Pseudomonas sp. LP_7_YM TaxID=2485137 RepID=UPI0021153106|nr:GNAT family N-acetyltransferase [Pseudomonas sp. LP_7_YM]